MRGDVTAGADEGLPVAIGLIGVVGGEFCDGVVEAGGAADVAGEYGGVSSAGVAAGEYFAAEAGVFEQACGFDGGEVDGGLVIVELADEVVAALDGGPSEEGVGLELHGALAFDGAAALVVGLKLLAEVRSVGGGDFLFDLKEERVTGTVALEVDAVVAEADGAGADDLEGDVERGVLGEEVLALGLQALGVGGEGVEDFAGDFGTDPGEVGRDGFEDAMRAGACGEFGGCGALVGFAVASVVRASRLWAGVARSARRRTSEMGWRVRMRWTWKRAMSRTDMRAKVCIMVR